MLRRKETHFISWNKEKSINWFRSKNQINGFIILLINMLLDRETGNDIFN